jgi:hypothetical protein
LVRICLFVDETQIRCSDFMPGTFCIWYNMHCRWCTNLTNINHVTRYKHIWSSLWKGRQFDNNKSAIIDLRIWKRRRFENRTVIWDNDVSGRRFETQIDVQSSNRRPILKYMAVFHFLKSTSYDVTDVYFKWRHTC